MKQKDRQLSWTRTVYLLVALVLVSLALILLSQGGQLLPVERVTSGVFTPVQQFAHDMTSGAGTWIDSLRRGHDLEEENLKLRTLVDSLTSENAQLQEKDRENQELRKLVKFQMDRPDVNGVVASIIGGDSSGQMEILTIDQGSDNGVKTGMAVVNSGGVLVGQIYAVKKDRATVLLITDHASSVAIATQRTKTPGTLMGKWQESGSMVVQHIPRDADVKEGDLLVTTGVGGVIPPGLIVGLLKGVHASDMAMEKEAEAYPLGLDSLENVLVLTNSATTGK